MKNNWIYPVICLVLLNATILGQFQLISLGLLLVWLVRLVALQQARLLKWTIVISILGMARFGWQYQQNLTMTVPQQQIFKIQPDTVHINGAQVQFLATGQTDHQSVLGYYYCQSKSEKRQWQLNQRPLVFKQQLTFESVQPVTNRNQFDYGRFLKQQRACFYQVKLPPMTNFIPIANLDVSDWLPVLRQKAAIRLRQLPPALCFHAQMLLLGLRDGQTDSYQATLSRLGVVHLLSLSGLHVYYLVQLLRTLATYSRIPREWLNWVLLMGLPCYGIFVGSGTSISRAIGFIVLRLVAEQFGWQQTRLDIWSIVLLMHLFWQPYVLQSMGGQLSYLMAFALIYLQGQSGWTVSWWLSWLSLPLCLRYYFRWHLLTVLLNSVMVPLFLPVVLGLILVAVVMQPISLTIVASCEWFLQQLYRGLNWIATLPHLTITFGKLPLLALLVIVGGTLLLLTVTTKRRRQSLYRMIMVAYCGSFLWIHYPPLGRVIMFDIGQGDSILIQQPFNRHQLLIDTGGQLALPQAKWQRQKRVSRVERITANYLYSQGIDSLDAIAVTHQDADHIGDLGQLLQLIKVKQIICAAGLPSNQQFQRQIRSYMTQTRVKTYLAGDQFKLGRQSYYVLAPVKPGSGHNADSLVIWAQLGSDSWLFTGDLERAGELALLKRYPQLPVAYLKVGHHGSKTASHPTFIQKFKLKGALISAGRQNRYHHPHAETLATLKNAHVPYWVTAESGMLEWQYGFGSNANQIKTMIKDRINDD